MKLEKFISPFSMVFGDTRDLWIKADAAVANQNPAAAAKIYRRLSKRKPKDAEGYQYCALSHYRLNKPEDAVRILEAGLRKHPEASRHHLLNHYVRISSEMQAIERAIRFIQADSAENAHVCKMLLDMRFEESHIRSNLLEYCLQQGFIDLALEGAGSIVGGYETLMILWKLGDLLLQQGRVDDAESIYRKISSRDRASQEDYYYAGLAECRLKNPSGALDIFEEALQAIPASRSGYLFEQYLRMAAEMNEIRRAVQFVQSIGVSGEPELCETLFALESTGSYMRVNVFEYCLKSGLDALAERFLAVIKTTYDDFETWWRLADILTACGRAGDAREIYKAIAAREPQAQMDYHYVAMSEYRLKNTETAVEKYEAALKLSPEDSSGILFESYFAIAGEIGLLDRVMDFVQTLYRLSEEETYQKLFDLRFDNATVRIALISYSLKHGMDERVAAGLEFMRKNHDDFETWWRLADILTAHKRGSDAKEIYMALRVRVPKTQLEYHYVAMSEYRLKNPEVAVEKYEAALNLFPEDFSGFLFESYFAIAGEIGALDRVMNFVQNLYRLTEEEAYHKLFNLRIGNASVRIALIGYSLKHGMEERVEAGLAFMNTHHDELVPQWMLADLLEKHGRITQAEALYTKLAERVPASADEYYYASVAQLRLGRPERCLDIIEQGQRQYPHAELLSTLYVQLCATNLDFDRYSRFKLDISGGEEVVSKLDFYKLVIRNGAAESFILNYKEIGANCDTASFEALQDEFLSMLKEDPPSFSRAKIIVFFSRYLDADDMFTARLFDVLQHAKVASDESKGARHALQLLYTLTPPMIPHFPADPRAVADRFTQDSLALAQNAVTLHEPMLDMTNNWTPWQYIFCLAVPDLYHKALSAFEKIVFASWPRLNFTSPHVSQRLASANQPGRKIRIGFTVHDSMPMMSGLVARLDPAIFETVFLRPGRQGTSATARDWVARVGETVEYSDADAYAAIETIAEQKLDIIVSGPAVAAIFYPMMARLAPLQMVLLEPNWTDGLTNSDYYISWQLAEPEKPADFYKSAVGFLQHPPYWIERPAMRSESALSEEKRNEIRRRVLGVGPESRVYLCANTLPKIHPQMDEIFYALLDRDPNANLVLLRGDYPPGKSLKARLKERLGPYYDRVKFLKTLSKDDAHSLLQAVDCSLDSYPLCGMSSSFDGMMLGVPIVTLPSDIPFGNWTAAIYDYIGVTGLTAKNVDEYVDIAMRLASDREWREQKSVEMRAASSRYVESKESADEFQEFLIQAWERKRAGLPEANWLSGTWQ